MLLLSPGPGICDPDVLNILSQPCIHHRNEYFKTIYMEIIASMRTLLHAPDSEFILMNGSGSTGMEGALKNLINKEDRVLSIRCGYFSDRFYQMVSYQSEHVYSLQYPNYETYHLEDVAWMLKHNKIDAVLVTHSETETGSLQNLQQLGELCHLHHVLLIVDSISGVVMNEVRMQDWHIDCLIMASQKGFLLPPGLSMTALSKAAVAKMENVQVDSYVFDYKAMLNKQHDDARIHTTPNVSFYLGLHSALKKLTSVSTTKIAAYYKELHDEVCDKLNQLGFTILSRGHESNSLIVCKTPKGHHAKELQQKLEAKGIRIETGLNDKEDRILRIGIMNAVTRNDLNQLITALEGILYET